MRPGQNKRMRGRNNNGNNNRKGPNPLTRSYESNGPDVKIRGTAHHVAEKYLQLARDAQSSGDPVAAENYLQHAEHYFRLIASAQQAQMGYARQVDESESDEGDDDDVGAMPDRFASPPERVSAFTPPMSQPYQERQPYQGERQPYNGDRGSTPDRTGASERNGQDGRVAQERGNYERQNRGDRPPRPQRPYRDQDGQSRQDRGQDFRNREARGQDYQGGDAREGGRDGFRAEQPNRDQPSREMNGRADYTPRDFAAERQPDVARQPEPLRQAEPTRQPEPLAQPDPVRAAEAVLPSFITAPVRLTAPSMGQPSLEPEPVVSVEGSPNPAEIPEDGARFPVRRRRRTRAAIAADLAEAAARAGEAPTGNE